MVSRALAFAIIKPATTTFVQATFSESQFTHLYKTLIDFSAGAPYNKWIASLELHHKEHNNDP